MKTILLFKPPLTPTARFSYNAIYSFAETHDWKVQTIDYINGAISQHWHGLPAPNPNVRDILA
ncbi:MAG: hypothetical protein KBT68_11845, partial [bacterium]|nr:hypothetical protein [Candidatus Colisoma equi]